MDFWLPIYPPHLSAFVYAGIGDIPMLSIELLSIENCPSPVSDSGFCPITVVLAPTFPLFAP